VSGFRLPDYLDHIREAASDARSFIDGTGKDDFFIDKRTQNAVVMSLLVIGHAAAKVMDRYPDFAGDHTEIPWQLMRGTRNRIAHGYFEIDFNIVWDTATTILPDLLASLAVIRIGDDPEGDGAGQARP
jgi:uncharacterized protein with HEPN domain